MVAASSSSTHPAVLRAGSVLPYSHAKLLLTSSAAPMTGVRHGCFGPSCSPAWLIGKPAAVAAPLAAVRPRWLPGSPSDSAGPACMFSVHTCSACMFSVHVHEVSLHCLTACAVSVLSLTGYAVSEHSLTAYTLSLTPQAVSVHSRSAFAVSVLFLTVCAGSLPFLHVQCLYAH